MSKYVIDTTLDNVKKVIAMGVTKGGAIWTDTTDIENLEELNSDYINEHFGDLQDTAYQKGFEKGKDVRIKGCEGCMYQDTTIEHNPCNLCCNAFLNRWTAKQTNENVKRGDVVRNKNNGLIYIVTLVGDNGYVLLGSDGNFATSCITNTFEKTGRHFDIDKILEDMSHD